MMGTLQSLKHVRSMATRLHAAQSLQALDAIYVDWIGYSLLADDPGAEFDCVYDILRDYVSEVCASLGIHVIDAWSDEPAILGALDAQTMWQDCEYRRETAVTRASQIHGIHPAEIDRRLTSLGF